MIYNVVTLTEASAVTRIVDEIVNYVEKKDEKSQQGEDGVRVHDRPVKRPTELEEIQR